jgi:hypothetical protein
VFIALELVTRTVLLHSSKDLSRFAAYPGRATALMQKPGPHTLFIGNSITEHGVDPALVATELGGASEAFTADSSHINTWYWMATTELWRRSLSPDLLVITFHGGSLEDGNRLEIGRLAQFFTTRADWSELFEHDLTSLDQRGEFLLSSVWATYAFGDRIKQRLLGLIPGYMGYAQYENQQNLAHDRSTKDRAAPRSWTTLDRFLARAKEHHTRLVFVAFPTLIENVGDAIPYEIAPELPAKLEAAGAMLLDLRKLPELDRAKHYDDDIHLNEAGKLIYTRRLIAELRAHHLP